MEGRRPERRDIERSRGARPALYFTGDTESTDQLLAARDLDVAFVSPWLLRAASRAGARIDAKRIVVYHHQSGEQVPECRDGCVVPRQGEVLKF